MLNDPSVAVTRGRTRDNADNQPRPPVSIRGKLLRTRPKGPVPLQQRIIPDLGIDDRRPLLRPQSAKLPRQLQRRHAASPSGAGPPSPSNRSAIRKSAP